MYHWDAEAKIDSIERAVAQAEAIAWGWGTEQQAWKTITQAHSYENLQKYLKLYPTGKHSKIAKKEIIDYEVNRDFVGEHGNMPTMSRTKIASGQYSSISVTNQTSYEMTLLYSGERNSERLVIQEGRTKSIKLPNDQYRVSARVNASSVRPYVGKVSLMGGEYSAIYYISTSRY